MVEIAGLTRTARRCPSPARTERTRPLGWKAGAGSSNAYDEARIAYHSELQVVRTSTVKGIAHQGRPLPLLNQREHGARRGLIVSGEWTTGKTTALKQLGRLHELRVRQRSPGSQRIPVVYITAPPKGFPRKLAMEFARFLGLPVIGPRHNTIDVTSAVCQVLRTGGMIGSLSHLIRAAAISAILDGTERITRTTVKNIRIDHSSETLGHGRSSSLPRTG